MKFTRKAIVAMIGILLLLNYSMSGKSITPKEREEIETMCSELQEAIEHRKFADAKEVISVLMPLLKKDIKTSKKVIATYQKQKVERSELENFVEKYNRKVSLYASAKKLIESSPAAIRVKGSNLINMLNEYSEIGEI